MKTSPQCKRLKLTHLDEATVTLVENLYQKIRYAEEPDDPQIITRFLTLSANQFNKSKRLRRQCLLIQFQLLLDTAVDEYLPAHWRNLCLNHIYNPLFTLQRLADCKQSQRQVNELFYELRIIGGYFQLGF